MGLAATLANGRKAAAFLVNSVVIFAPLAISPIHRPPLNVADALISLQLAEAEIDWLSVHGTVLAGVPRRAHQQERCQPQTAS